MQPEKKTNFASILVVIIALVFILGGVYLLNRSINQTNDTNKTSDNTTETSSSNNSPVSTNDKEEETITEDSEDSTDDLASTNDSQEPNNNQTSTTPASTSTSNTTASTSTVTTSTTTSTAGTATTSSTSTTTPVAELTKNQIVAKYLETLANGQTRWEIVRCGIPNSRYCKAGSRMSLIDIQRYTSLEVNKEYIFEADISDGESGFQINIINSVKPL